MVWKEDDEESVNSSCSTIVNYDQQISSDEEDLEAESTSTKQVKYFFCIIKYNAKNKAISFASVRFCKEERFSGNKTKSKNFFVPCNDVSIDVWQQRRKWQ